MELGERLDERHISKIIESFLDPILWDDDSEHAIFVNKIKKILSKSKLSIESHANKEYSVMDEAGWRNWQHALLVIHQQEAYEIERYHNEYGDDKEIERKSLRGREGEISNPVEVGKDFYILKLEKIYDPARDKPFIPNEEDVKRAIEGQRLEEFANSYMNKLRQKSMVEAKN